MSCSENIQEACGLKLHATSTFGSSVQTSNTQLWFWLRDVHLPHRRMPAMTDTTLNHCGRVPAHTQGKCTYGGAHHNVTVEWGLIGFYGITQNNQKQMSWISLCGLSKTKKHSNIPIFRLVCISICQIFKVAGQHEVTVVFLGRLLRELKSLDLTQEARADSKE